MTGNCVTLILAGRDIAYGRFHIRGRTNRKTENGTNKSSDINWPSGKTIFSRRFARRDEQVDDSTT